MANTAEVLPEHHCNTCLQCNNSYCKIFSRPVDVEFNRCFKHSKYDLFAKPFKVNKNLELIMKQEQEAKEIQKSNRLIEETKFREALKNELEKAS